MNRSCITGSLGLTPPSLSYAVLLWSRQYVNQVSDFRESTSSYLSSFPIFLQHYIGCVLLAPSLVAKCAAPTMYQFHQEQHSNTLRLELEKLKPANSWVMTAPGGHGFVKLPNERILYTSPSRTSLQISTPNTFPAAQPFSSKSDSGVVYITNQRVRTFFLPKESHTDLL